MYSHRADCITVTVYTVKGQTVQQSLYIQSQGRLYHSHCIYSHGADCTTVIVYCAIGLGWGTEHKVLHDNKTYDAVVSWITLRQRHQPDDQ